MKAIFLCFLLAAASFAESVKYCYDDWGRLVRAEYANGLVLSYSYDKAGNLTKREVTGNLPQQKTSTAAKTKKVMK